METNWIHVEDKLPGIGMKVLAVTEKGIQVCLYTDRISGLKSHLHFEYGNRIEAKNVVFWMHLPAIPNANQYKRCDHQFTTVTNNISMGVDIYDHEVCKKCGVKKKYTELIK